MLNRSEPRAWRGRVILRGRQLGHVVQLGLSTADYVLYTLVTGIWNLFTLMGLPVVNGRPGHGYG